MSSVPITTSLLITVAAALGGAFGGQLLAHELAGRRERAAVRERRLEQDRVLYLDAVDRLVDALLVMAQAITRVEADQSLQGLHRTGPGLIEAHFGVAQAWTSYQARVRPADVAAVGESFTSAYELATEVTGAAQDIRTESDRDRRKNLYGPLQGASAAFSEHLGAFIQASSGHSERWYAA